MRNVLAVITGYTIFVVSSIALFKISGQVPHAIATTRFMIFTAIYGAVFSFIAGLVTQVIARTRNLKINYVLAFILAGFATFSFFKSTGEHWTQLMAIFIFAPVTIIGGAFYKK